MRTTGSPTARQRSSSRGAKRLIWSVAVGLLGMAAPSLAEAQGPLSPAPPHQSTDADRPTFRDLLVWSDILPQSLEEIPAEPRPSESERHLIEQVLFRLARAGADVLNPAMLWQPSTSSGEPPLPGDMVELRGRVIDAHGLQSARRVDDKSVTVRCVMQLDSVDGQAVIWTSRVPDAWLVREEINERAAVRGAFAGIREVNGFDTPVILANRVAWYPDDEGIVETPLGRRMLGDLGVDVGLLDEIEHRAPLAHEDRTAFYSMLAAVNETEPEELIRAARTGLAAYAKRWGEGPAPELRDGKVLRQVVLDAASQGRYSVAPLFLDAEDQTGELILLEGIARRAIRIEVEDLRVAAAKATPSGLDHYFELEIFTSDSQNLPIVCCTADLPAGFPTGDAIREPVRLAGFFFKLWRYDSREKREASDSVLPFAATAAPLVIAAEPIWPLAEPRAASDVLGWIIASVFVAAVIAIGAVLWRWSCEDRRARMRARR